MQVLGADNQSVHRGIGVNLTHLPRARPSSKNLLQELLGFPETIQQSVFSMHVFFRILNEHNIFKLILKADLWSILHTAIIAQFTGSTAILRVTMT